MIDEGRCGLRGVALGGVAVVRKNYMHSMSCNVCCVCF